ncbi:hypothetical protein B0H10DRAFT_2304329 [Mycena sp. CBHHK59/15]|nr:hypothetical protein B0H10DRAFT_2304329 [Mycena sp. CBHHK59/15]
MADRARRVASTAHPGDVINNAKQKRRSPEEIERDKLAKQQAKEEKRRLAAEKRKSGVRRVAEVEAQMRQQDEDARASAARPDLRSVELKRSIIAQSKQVEETPGPVSSSIPGPSASVLTDVNMDDAPVTPNDNSDSGEPSYAPDPMDDGDDSDNDPDYEDTANSSEERNQDDPENDQQSDNDPDLEAEIAAFAKALRQKKAKGKAKEKDASKPQKGQLHTEIQEERGGRLQSTKRKPTEVIEPAEPAKKPKAAEGGLKTNWQKDLGLQKPTKKSTSSWNRSGDVPPGEFDQDEDESSMQAARATKSQETSATTKMGITLTKKAKRCQIVESRTVINIRNTSRV